MWEGGIMYSDFFLITTEVPSWVILVAAITIIIFALGAVHNLGDRFRTTKWVMRNKLNDEIWVTNHRFSRRALQKLMRDRCWDSEIIGRAE
jgi:hypothetical protein